MPKSSSARFYYFLFTMAITLHVWVGEHRVVAEEEKVLNVYNWIDYVGPNTLRDFTTSTGIRINYDTYDSNEALLAKIQTGNAKYDVIFPSDYLVTVLAKANLLAPLNKRALSNSVNIDTRFVNLPFDPGNKFTMPYQWGTTGMGVRIDKVKTPIDSWMQLLKPVPSLSGYISMLNDMREVIGVGLKALGYSVNSTNPAEITAAKNLLMMQKEHVLLYDSAIYKHHLDAGEVYISHAWSGNVSSLYWKGNRNLRFVLPKEGGVLWVDNVAIPASAPHKENAHQFIDFLMRPRSAADVTNYTYYASPNRGAKNFIRKEILEDTTIYPPDSVLKKFEFIKDVGAATQYYDRAWSELKAR